MSEKTPQKKSPKGEVIAQIKIDTETGDPKTLPLDTKLVDDAGNEQKAPVLETTVLQSDENVNMVIVNTKSGNLFSGEVKMDIPGEVKELRTDIDECFRTIREWDVVEAGAGGQGFTSHKDFLVNGFVAAAHDSLMMGKAWLGDVLAQGDFAPSPYKAEYASVSEIAPTAETADTRHKIHGGDADGQLKNYENARQNIGRYLDRLEPIRIACQGVNTAKGRELAIAFTAVYTYLKEARFHLGYAIGDIRDKEGK